MRVGIYYRVSTKLQEQKYSLAAQREELSKYVKQQNWTIISECEDVDSGGKLDKEGLNNLLDIVEEGKIDVVLCIDQDRLSRLDTVHWEYLKTVLRENNVKIAEPGMLTDLDNEDDEFISDIKNLISKREKNLITRRMQRGRIQKMREGNGWGKAPIGYIYNEEKDQYEIDEKWAWVIEFIDNCYLNKQMGMQVIANELNKISKTPSGTMWNKTLVHRRLVSKVFHGVMEKTFSNGETIVIEGIYPPLRTKETWTRIQQKRKRTGEKFNVASRGQQDVHILKKTEIVCGVCGEKISYKNCGRQGIAVRCYLKHRDELKKTKSNVCNISINLNRIEPNFYKTLKDIMVSEDLAKRYINIEDPIKGLNDLSDEIIICDNQIKFLQSEQDRLLDMYLENKIDKVKLIGQKKRLEKELQTLIEMKQQIQDKLTFLEKSQCNYDLIYEYLETVENIENELTHLEKVQLIGEIFPRAILYKDKLVLRGKHSSGVQIEVTVPIDPLKRSK